MARSPFSQLMTFRSIVTAERKAFLHRCINDDGGIEFDSPWQIGEEAQFVITQCSLLPEKVRHGYEITCHAST
ncbi:hypothetical protein OK016_08525 [Vibrio chagasii]|nr:hypothetical protein [Vibrio chagasii]